MVDDVLERAGTLSERLVSDMGHGVLVVASDGRLLVANPAARELLGLTGQPEETEAGTALAGMPGLAALVARALSDPSNVESEEIRVVVGGTARLLAVRRTPLRDRGAGAAVILSLTDVTRVRERETKERIAAMLAGVGQLTSHIAHELKNPLGIVKLYALLLERQLRVARPDSRELVEKMARAVDELSTLVTRLAALGLGGLSDRKWLSPAQLMDEVLTSVKERADGVGIEVVRQYDPRPATVYVGAQVLRDAIQALTINAIEAMPNGGTLTLGFSCRPSEVELTIQDTGPGIAESAAERLFEPFVTTKPDHAGLGMAVAHHVIDQHGGRILVRTQSGDGTTIRVILPAGSEAEDHD